VDDLKKEARWGYHRDELGCGNGKGKVGKPGGGGGREINGGSEGLRLAKGESRLKPAGTKDERGVGALSAKGGGGGGIFSPFKGGRRTPTVNQEGL